MKLRKRLFILTALIVVMSFIVSAVLAEDGEIFRRNVSKTPSGETEKAAVYMMDFYVPAQDSTGLVGPVDNYCLDDGLTGTDGSSGSDDDEDCAAGVAYEPRDYAKPLVSVYIDDRTEEEISEFEVMGGITFGEFDAYVGVSLDDGTSWRTENISRSAELSSFVLANGHAYPGDVHNVVHQVAEDKILMVWVSKYCQSGFPLYARDPDNTDDAAYLADLENPETWGKNELYLYDFFGVAGNQGSVDYTLQGYPEIGEIPYSCVWSARGKLLPGDDPMTADTIEATHVVWTKPERLTSGVRDANLPAVDCAKNAGCALTWQEDPEGLRPGKGLGPGEGWSGAIANAKTDIWYSYISFADFDYVIDEDDADGIDNVMLIEDYEALKGTDMDKPKPYVPMAMPVRITDNDMCRATSGLQKPEDPFCWIDFDTLDVDVTTIDAYLEGLTEPEPDADFCASSVAWTNPGGTTLDICVTEDERWMLGRVASTRVRMALKPYTPPGAPDHDGDGIPDASAWLSFAAEETKALGVTGDTDGDGVADVDPVDIGKNMYYYSFDFAKPYNLHVNQALDAVDTSAYVVQQGGMINQPALCSPYMVTTADTNPEATCAEPGGLFDVQLDPFTGEEYYLTEIARRFALTLNNIANITNEEINESGLAGMLIYKQGIIWQGGPADIMLRRLVVPDDFDPTVDNPFAFENMECDEWLYTDGTNSNYLEGLCMSPAINISATTIVRCDGGEDNDTCADTFPVADDGSIPDEEMTDQFPKVYEWRQCDGTTAIEGCEEDNDLDDQSWENPFDVSKGHRGFLYGDNVMMMYAWSPNWQSNAVGNDHYNLYQRRSFDGGLTWTTTPAELGGEGLVALEYYYGDTIGDFVPYLHEYQPGAFEQARNLSLLKGNKITILDPRYSPAGGLKQYSTIRTDWLTAHSDTINFTSDQVLPYPDDAAIDPSKYYLVYETGDNTTVDVGEAVPLNLYYSRATTYGDVLEWYDYVNDEFDGDPEDGELPMTEDIEPRWPWLENAAEDLSGEASVVLNPGGTFAYNVWNQWREEILPDGTEFIYDSDMWYRRLLWLPETLEDGTVAEYAPIAYFVYTGSTTTYDDDTEITFIASARDLDKLGEGEDIVEYEWTLDGTVVSNAKLYNAPPRTLSIGWHGFSFRAKDNEGHWSRPITITIQVFESLVTDNGYKIFLPINFNN